MKPLYLLAFLLTANHKQAERCFASTLEDAFKEKAVFKEWARSWMRRSVIENAIEIVSPASARTGEKRDLWNAGSHETRREHDIDAVTKLAPLLRFVFVMLILECHSNWDCALLLGCNMNRVVQARRKALRQLPDLAAVRPADLSIGSRACQRRGHDRAERVGPPLLEDAFIGSSRIV